MSGKEYVYKLYFYQVCCGLVSFLCREIMTATTAQVGKCFQLCCDLTEKYCSVDLVTIDKRTRKVIILVREEINIEIEHNGEWKFV